jgi:hypothetical protein
MKISSIGPFSPPQETDLDRSDEVELALSKDSVGAMVPVDPESGLSQEQQETKGGLLRLMDLIEKHHPGRKKRTRRTNSRIDKALASYEQTMEGDLDLKGHNFRKII